MDTEITLLTRRADLLRRRISRTRDCYLRENLRGDLHRVDHRIDVLMHTAS